MLNYHTAIVILTVFDMVLLSLVIRSNLILTRDQKRYFIYGNLAVIIGGFCEWLTFYLDEHFTDVVALQIAVKALEMIAAPFVAVFCVSSFSSSKRIVRTILAASVFNAAMIVLSCFTGFIFYFDANGGYHHASLYGLYMGAYGVCYLLLLIAMIQFVRGGYNRGGYLIVLTALLFTTGMILQIVWDNVRIDYLAAAMALNLLYISYLDVVQSMDSLTRVHNRHSYDNRINNLRGKACIVSIDVDDFKLCNDNFGHIYGDKCLRIVGDVLRQACPPNGICYRTGGDEFSLVIDGEVENIEGLIQRVHDMMDRERSIEPCLPHLSTGYASYDPARGSAVATIEAADAMMFDFKNCRKAMRAAGQNPGYAEVQNAIR